MSTPDSAPPAQPPGVPSPERRRAFAMSAVANRHEVVPAAIRWEREGGNDSTPDASGRLRKVVDFRGSWRRLTTVEDVRRWWDAHPEDFPAVTTGAVVLVDLDTDEAAAWWEQHVRTTGAVPGHRLPSISGRRHEFYALAEGDPPVKNSSGELHPGLDTRGVGGLAFLGGHLPTLDRLPVAPRGLPLYDPDGRLTAVEEPDAQVDTQVEARPAPSGSFTVEPRPGAVLAPATPAAFEQPARVFTAAQAQDYLRPIFDALAAAPRGRINERLNEAAVAAGHFVPAFYEAKAVRAWLVRAQRTAWVASGGADDGDYRAALATIGSGLRRGMREPYQLVDEADLAEPDPLDTPPLEVVDATRDDSQDGGQEGERPEPASWARVDLSGYLQGSIERKAATLMRRPDGVCLLYPGLVHSLHGESESGKSWVAQAEAARVLIESDATVLYVDFESDPGAVVERLLELGVPADAVAARFDYRRPEASPSTAVELAAWHDMLAGRYALAVVDGVTDSLGLFGGKITDNDEVAAWMRRFPRRLAARTGAAVVLIDHVTKDSETRGRFAIGGQAKMAGLDGAAYVVDVVDPLGRGLRGVLTLRVAKDRPGSVRGHAGPMRRSDRTQEVARFVLDSTGDRLAASIELPKMTADSDDGPDRFRPTRLMERVSKVVEAQPGAGSNLINSTVTGRAEMVRAALLALVDEGYVHRESVPHGKQTWLRYTSLRPYREAEDQAAGEAVTTLSEATASNRVQPRPNYVPDAVVGGADPTASRVPPPTGTRTRLDGPTDDLGGSKIRDAVEPPLPLPEECHCGRPVDGHPAGAWHGCEGCGLAWHRFGAGGRPRCPRCHP